MSNLPSLTREVVDRLAPDLNFDQRRFATDYCVKEVSSDQKGGTRREWPDVVGSLNQAERSARIRVQDTLADALRKCVGKLESHKSAVKGWEGDMPIKMSNLPQHIQLLLNLANPPSSSTQSFAYSYLHRQPSSGPTSDQILFDEIMSEPFSGAHWGKGYDEEVLSGWTDSSSESDELSSSSEEEIVTPALARLVSRKEVQVREAELRVAQGRARLEKAKEALEGLAGGYWRTGGIELKPTKEDLFGWRDLNTLTSAASLAAKLSGENTKVISAEQFQRELLFALSGRPGVFFTFDSETGCTITAAHPQVKSLSPAGIKGILQVIAQRSAQAHSLRRFVHDTLMAPSSSRSARSSHKRTQEAYAEACRGFMQEFDTWVSDIESAFVRGVLPGVPIIATPISLTRYLDDRFSKRFDILTSLVPLSNDPAVLLDSIHALIISAPSDQSKEQTLDLFIKAAAPVWSMLRQWLINGMPLPTSLTSDDHYSLRLDDDESPIDPEFFVKRDRDVSWTDEDFWEAGYIVDPEAGWPSWMGETKDIVLEAGKARGLLKGLIGDDRELETIEGWKTLSGLCAGNKVPDIQREIEAFLAPMCQIAIFQLRRVLEEECGLEQHLEAIEGIMYFKAHDTMEQYLFWLHDQIRSKKRWNDMHILTTGLRDAIDQTDAFWLNPSALRLTLAPSVTRPMLGNSKKSGNVLKTLGGIKVGYNVPFPLSVLFTTTSMELRSAVFGFLCQIDYARRCLSVPASEEKEGAWRLRHRLRWFIDTIWVWIAQRVIEVQSEEFKSKMAGLSSLKEMIAFELDYAKKIRTLCFLHDHTRETHEHVLAILQMAMDLSGKHFTSSWRKDADSDEEDRLARSETRSIASSAGEGYDLVELEGELVGRVAEVRLAVEGLSLYGGGGEGEGEMRAIWAMLGFALDDWK